MFLDEPRITPLPSRKLYFCLHCLIVSLVPIDQGMDAPARGNRPLGALATRARARYLVDTTPHGSGVH